MFSDKTEKFYMHCTDGVPIACGGAELFKNILTVDDIKFEHCYKAFSETAVDK